MSANRGFDPLDFQYAGRGFENRWNEKSEPTLYLASDDGVLITEWGRHIDAGRGRDVVPSVIERVVYRFDLSLDAVIDLRNPDIATALSLPNAPYCFLDFVTTRAVAGFIRYSTSVQGLIVPPVGMLDKPDRWNLVLFLEKLPEPAMFIRAVTNVGPLTRG